MTRYFKLCDSEGAVYLVRRDKAGEQWELTQFLAPRGDLGDGYAVHSDE